MNLLYEFKTHILQEGLLLLFYIHKGVFRTPTNILRAIFSFLVTRSRRNNFGQLVNQLGRPNII